MQPTFKRQLKGTNKRRKNPESQQVYFRGLAYSNGISGCWTASGKSFCER